MPILTWILDPATGALVAEGVTAAELSRLAGSLLPAPRRLDCARPHDNPPLPTATSADGAPLRVARIYHGSVVDGPGRRSVVQLQGCPIRCPGCHVPKTHDPAGGVTLRVPDILAALLDAAGAPRDGVTVLGGEPFAQPEGLVSLLRALKARTLHTVVYSGYTRAALVQRREGSVHEALSLADLLIDGPYVATLATGAGRWRGSRNQRLIPHPGRLPSVQAADRLRRRPPPAPDHESDPDTV
jgi:anaerobic ribonucleoside-triphosphate reductase activating protein